MLPPDSQMYSSLQAPAGDAAVVQVCIAVHWCAINKLVSIWTALTLASPMLSGMEFGKAPTHKRFGRAYILHKQLAMFLCTV